MQGEDRADGEGGRQWVREPGKGCSLPISSDFYCKCIGKPRRTFMLGNYKRRYIRSYLGRSLSNFGTLPEMTSCQ